MENIHKEYSEGIKRLYLLINHGSNRYSYYKAFNALQCSARDSGMLFKTNIMSKATFYRKVKNRSFSVIQLMMLDNIDVSEFRQNKKK